MIKVEKAESLVLSNIKKVLPREKVNIENSLGRVLAEDIRSSLDIPPFNNSAMDGYAVRSIDTPGNLEVIEEVPAGYVAKKRLTKGKAIRIMTGAPLPAGADSVVMKEDTAAFGGNPKSKIQILNFVKILKAVKHGENIRKKGEDIKKGERVIKKGVILKPSHLGVLASLGISKVKVSKKPKIAILNTGDEIVGINEKLKPGKIRNSNRYSLSGQVLLAGAEPVSLGIARDRKEEIRSKILEGIKNDMLIISGGVSVGEYDLVHKTLASLGMDIKFQKIAIKPGKPVVFGLLNKRPVFGLPGNPVASMVSFELFVKPVIFKMMGCNEDYTRYVDAVSDSDIEKKKGLKFFVRAVTEYKGGEYRARTTGPQGSGILKSMTIANSLIELPEDLEAVKKGDVVRVKWLNS